MKDSTLFRIKELKKRFPIKDLENGITVLWFNPNFTIDDRRHINLKAHHHTFYEVHFVLEGSLTYKIETKDFEMHAGDFLFIPPNCEHSISSQSEVSKKIGLAFSYSPTDEKKYLFRKEPFLKNSDDFVESIFQTVAYALDSDNGAGFYVLKNAILSLVSLMADTVASERKEILDPKPDERLERAKGFISDNSNRDISTEEVASFVHLSAKHLGRLFKEHENTTVSDFIAKARCERAKRLLNDENISIAQIAERLCFSNEYNFSRFFKRVEGITPGRYKKLH